MHAPYINSDIVSGEFPGVEIKPVVGHLDLVTVNDLLLKDAVAVPQAVAPGRVVETGEAVEEASGQPAQTTVAEGGVVLLFNDVLDAETELGETSYGQMVSNTVSAAVWSRPRRGRSIPLATSFWPMFNMALSSALPIRNSRLK